MLNLKYTYFGKNKYLDFFPYLYSIVYYIFNTIFICKTFSLSHDSISYYNGLLNNPNELFPHHLIFAPIVSSLGNLIKIFRFESDVIAYTLVNTLAGSIIVFTIYHILTKNFNFSLFSARVTTIIISFSYGFWFYNLNIETYQLPMIFIFISIYFLTRYEVNKHYIVISGFLGGIAVLFHQLHGLFGVVSILYLFFLEGRKSIKNILIFSVIFNLTWIVGYGLTIINLGLNSFEKIKHWFFLYNYEMNAWTSFDSMFLIKPFIGFFRSIISIHGLFINTNFYNKVTSLFINYHLDDDAYLVRNLTNFDFILYFLLIAILFLFLLKFIIYALRNLKFDELKLNKIIIAVIFLIIYSSFFIFWVPENLEFWIPQSIMFWILLGKFLDKILVRKNKIILSIIFILTLFTINFRFTISLAKDISNDIYYTEVQQVSKLVHGKSILIYHPDWLISTYYKIFAPGIEFITIDKLKNHDMFSEREIVDLKTKYSYVLMESQAISDLKFIDYNKLKQLKIGKRIFYLF